MPDAPKTPRRTQLKTAIEKLATAGQVALQMRVAALKDQLDGLKGAKVLTEADVVRIATDAAHKVLEKELPGLMTAFLLEQLGSVAQDAAPAPKKAPAAAAGPSACGHKNNMSKCAGCQAKRAAKGC